MNHDKTPSVVSIVRGMIQGHAFEKTVRVRGKGYMAALRQLHPGEEVFLSGAHNANELARLVFGKGNYRTHRTPEGTYVAYTPHDVERCPTCGAVRHADHVGHLRQGRWDCKYLIHPLGKGHWLAPQRDHQ